MIERVARSLFFALVVGLSVAAAINIYAGKRFAGIDPQVLGALAALGTGALYTAILM